MEVFQKKSIFQLVAKSADYGIFVETSLKENLVKRLGIVLEKTSDNNGHKKLVRKQS